MSFTSQIPQKRTLPLNSPTTASEDPYIRRRRQGAKRAREFRARKRADAEQRQLRDFILSRAPHEEKFRSPNSPHPALGITIEYSEGLLDTELEQDLTYTDAAPAASQIEGGLSPSLPLGRLFLPFYRSRLYTYILFIYRRPT